MDNEETEMIQSKYACLCFWTKKRKREILCMFWLQKSPPQTIIKTSSTTTATTHGRPLPTFPTSRLSFFSSRSALGRRCKRLGRKLETQRPTVDWLKFWAFLWRMKKMYNVLYNSEKTNMEPQKWRIWKLFLFQTGDLPGSSRWFPGK